MKRIYSLLTGLTLAFAVAPAFADTILISDTFTASNVTNGFELGAGVNSGITADSTRLTGTLATNLSYVRKGNKLDNAYSISPSNTVLITQGTQSGRFTVAHRGTTDAFDFGPALGVSSATRDNPKVYDIRIKMHNRISPTATGNIGRMTFAFGTVEGGGGNWSFGVQILPTVSGGPTNFYNIYKRIKIAASGLTNELNATIDTNSVPVQTDANFLLRVTDAGLESGSNYNSRVQVALLSTGTTNWIYDTETDAALTNGFRFETAARYVSFDQAPNAAADIYDDFHIALRDQAPAITLTIANNAGVASIGLQGTAGQTYVIERSLDLNSWTGIYTNTAPAGGLFQYNELPPATTSFYRGRTQ